VNLSKILKLKELFSKHRGANPVHMEFHDEDNPYAALQIDGKWGVKVTDAFKVDLERVIVD
jgi:hypothetical protein